MSIRRIASGLTIAGIAAITVAGCGSTSSAPAPSSATPSASASASASQTVVPANAPSYCNQLKTMIENPPTGGDAATSAAKYTAQFKAVKAAATKDGSATVATALGLSGQYIAAISTPATAKSPATTELGKKAEASWKTALPIIREECGFDPNTVAANAQNATPAPTANQP